MLAALVPLAAGITLAWALTSFTYTRSLEQRISEQIESTASLLAKGNVPVTPEVLRRIAALQQTDVALLDADRNLVLSSDDERMSGAVGLITRTPIASKTQTLIAELKGEPVALAARPMQAQADPRYSEILVLASLTDARTAARKAALATGFAALLVGGLLVLILYHVVRSITRPLTKLALVADQVAEGRRDVSLQIERDDELGALADSLQSMAARLDEYEKRLEEQSRLKALGEMSARIAHEVRNPLTGLKMHLELLAERVGETDRALVQNLLDEAKRLELVVNAALSSAREGSSSPVPENISSIADEVCSLMRPSLQHKGIELEARIGGDAVVTMDRNRIKQALLNLIVNASDALPGGGRILVRTEVDAGNRTANIVVEDSGPGMDPAAGAAERTGGSDKPFGLGLGLPLCRQVATEHGGSLRLERSDELGGARVVLELPLASPA
jgi:signal transduction histidine kinase